jgi:hypothetical protein
MSVLCFSIQTTLLCGCMSLVVWYDLTGLGMVCRFREFDELHNKLCRRFRNVDFPSLPAKGFSFGAQSEEFLDERLRGLEMYGLLPALQLDCTLSRVFSWQVLASYH